MDKRINDINLEDVLKQDELEERVSIAEKNKRKLKRRKRIIKALILVTILFLFGFYMYSDYSNIRVIDINGNVLYTKAELMKKAEIDYKLKSIFAPAFLIESRLEKDPLIEEVDVDKTWNGVVQINVKEISMIGYYEKKGAYYLVVEDGEDVKIKDSTLLSYGPFIKDLNTDQLNEYKEKVSEIDKENLNIISEITHHETSYNKNMLKIYMQDGHIVYTSMDGLSMLDNYLEIVKGLNTTHKCIHFVEETNSSYSEKCE